MAKNVYFCITIHENTHMTFIDSILLLIMLGALAIGWRKGLIKQLASIVSWVVGIVVCLFLGDTVTQWFLALNPEAANWPMPSITAKTVALSMLFMIVTITLRVIVYLSRKVVKMAGLGCVDRVAGAALFAFKYLFALSIALNLLFAFSPDADTFNTRHIMDNKPFEFTLDLMPRVLGSETMPSDSLPIYRTSPSDSTFKTPT